MEGRAGVLSASLAMAVGKSGNDGLNTQRRVVGVPHMISLPRQSFHKLYPFAVDLSQPGFVVSGARVCLVYAAAALPKPRVSFDERVEPLPPRSRVAPWDTSAITAEVSYTFEQLRS